jgi:hypothetical protein
MKIVAGSDPTPPKPVGALRVVVMTCRYPGADLASA